MKLDVSLLTEAKSDQDKKLRFAPGNVHVRFCDLYLTICPRRTDCPPGLQTGLGAGLEGSSLDVVLSH